MKYNQIILLKSTDNISLLKSILLDIDRYENVMLFTNKKSNFLQNDLQNLQKSLPNFETLYKNLKCLFLKGNLQYLNKKHGLSSFIDELSLITQTDKFETICFHRFDTHFSHIDRDECELIISNIIQIAHKNNKKLIFTINKETKIGFILNEILQDIVDIKKDISKNNFIHEQQFVLLENLNDTELIKNVFKQHNHDKKLLFLANTKPIFLRDSFRKVRKKLKNFDKIYKNLKSMFLKDSWTNLDKKYGKPFFIYEIESLMKNEEFQTLYFHKLDTIFDGASYDDCLQILEDIRDFAIYYNKKIIFSLQEESKTSTILFSILKNLIEFEQNKNSLNYMNFTQEPANTILQQPIKPNTQKVIL